MTHITPTERAEWASEAFDDYMGSRVRRLLDENAELQAREAELTERAHALEVENANLTHRLQIAQTQAALVDMAAHPYRQRVS